MVVYLVASGALSEANLTTQEEESDPVLNPDMHKEESEDETSPLTPSEETPR